MSNRYARILAAGGAAVLVAALAVPAALAEAIAGTWTVHPGGTITAMSGPVTVSDTVTGPFRCVSSTASGTLKSGSGLPGSHAGSLSAISFVNCSNAGGQRFALHPAGLPWHVNFSSYKSGVVTGTISHMHINLTTTQCRALIDGTAATASDGKVAFTYADSTGRLKLLTTGGNLHLYHVMGCFGVLHDSDPVTVSTIFTLSPRQTFTSP
jgi:hypothetical protein